MSISGVLSSSQIQSLVQDAETQYNAPITVIQAQESPLNTQISAYGNLSSVLGNLQSAVQSLGGLASLPQVQATVGNSSVLSASANNNAVSGSYQLTVSGLAAAQSLYSADYSSQTTAIGTGTIGIQVGSGTTVDVAISNSNDTLEGIANAVNQANVGVSASVVYDGTGYRLSVTGNQTGAKNSFTISTTGTALSGFSYVSGSYNMTENQAAADASVSLNGIALTSQTNTFSGAIAGVSFTVATTGSSSLTVGTSTSAAVSAIQGFVQAFNKASSEIQSLTAYTPASGSVGGSSASGASGTAGPLLGNPVAASIENQMLSIISTATSIGSGGASTAIGFGNVGITLTSSGTINLDTGALSAALSNNYAQVLGLFGPMAGSSNPAVQFASAASGTAPGLYSVAVTTNSSTLTSGTVNGYSASGVGGSMTVSSGPAEGLQLSISSGTLPTATLFFNQGISTSMQGLLSSALGSQGTLQQAQNDLQNQITAMNQQIGQYQSTSQQQVQALLNQFDNYENVSSSDSNTSNQLDAIFSSLFGGSSSGS